MAKIDKEKALLESAIKKLIRARDFGSDCVLSPDEAKVILTVATDTAFRIARIQQKMEN